VHDVAWPHPRRGPVVIPPSFAVPPLELLPDPLLDPELPELLELLTLPPLELEPLDVTPELLPVGAPLLLPLLATPLPLLLPVGWPPFLMGAAVPLELPLVSTGGVHVILPVFGGDEEQPEIETATNAAVPRLTAFRFFISDASPTVGLLDDGI
jgi:hypothetical protein